jgi:hypothetical protein
MLVCHFTRSPGSEDLPHIKPVRIASLQSMRDSPSYDKSLYVRTWSINTSSCRSFPESDSPQRAALLAAQAACASSPRSDERAQTNAQALQKLARKPPLPPDSQPRRRSFESACSGCALEPATAPAYPAAELDKCAAQRALSPAPDDEGDGPSVPRRQSKRDDCEAPSLPSELGSRSIFLANMSHELRTPLNGTVAVVELLLSTNVSPEQRDLLKTVLESSQSLTRILSKSTPPALERLALTFCILVTIRHSPALHLHILATLSKAPTLLGTLPAGSILDFAQLDSGMVELARSELNICDVVESCIDMVWPQALKKGLEVTFSVPREAMMAVVLGDSLRLRQMLVHLLSNAVKFTDQGSVEIEILAEQSDNALACAIQVRASGLSSPSMLGLRGLECMCNAGSSQHCNTRIRLGACTPSLPPILSPFQPICNAHIRL